MPTLRTHYFLLALQLNFMLVQLFSGRRTRFVCAGRQSPQLVTAQPQLRSLLLLTLGCTQVSTTHLGFRHLQLTNLSPMLIIHTHGPLTTMVVKRTERRRHGNSFLLLLAVWFMHCSSLVPIPFVFFTWIAQGSMTLFRSGKGKAGRNRMTVTTSNFQLTRSVNGTTTLRWIAPLRTP